MAESGFEARWFHSFAHDNLPYKAAMLQLNSVALKESERCIIYSYNPAMPLINNFVPAHDGTQPVRVLQFNLTERFENTHPEFAEQTRQLIASLGFRPGIVYHCNELPITAVVDEHNQTPYLKDGRAIHLHETFLSYVWCLTYTLVTLYEEAVAKPSQNQVAGQVLHTPDQQKIRSANELLKYGLSLVSLFTPWSLALPNPEQYDEVDAEWIHKINGVYMYAMNFILVHEYIHAERQHGTKATQQMQQLSLAEYEALRRELEREADAMAVDALQQGHHTAPDAEGKLRSTQVSSDLGNMVGLCCLLFFSYSVAKEARFHPSVVERIDTFISRVKPEPESGLWGIACVAFKLWTEHFQQPIALPPAVDGFEDLYYLMRDSLKNA